jgi:glycosyltransferase involved in cell wall biosynthesis
MAWGDYRSNTIIYRLTMQKDLISIVTPLYNGDKHIAETVESVLKQTYPLWEMIIVDDCSTDGGKGKEIARNFAGKDARISLLALESNTGSSGARNTGIKAARGEYIAFLDADDLWNDSFLERQLSFMKRMEAGIVYSSYRRISEDSHKEILAPFSVPPRVNYRAILKSLPILTSSAIIDRGKVGKHYFDKHQGSLRDDYVYWLYLLREHVDYAYGNPEILVSYRMRKDSVTANKLKMIGPHWKVLRNIERLSLLESSYYMCWWSWISFWKYIR